MAIAVVDQPVTGSDPNGGTGNQPGSSPGWLAGLPAELRDNEAFKGHKTVGDFAKSHLAVAQKAKDLEAKLANSIPKLPDGASSEERDLYFNSLGRPESPSGYELVGENKDKPGAMDYWKGEFHKLGLTKSQARDLTALYDRRINAMVDEYNANVLKTNTEAETSLKTEWGDKYAANVELVRRLWKTNTDTELDKAFQGEISANRVAIMRFVFRMAEKTGEDLSPSASHQRTSAPAGMREFYKDMPGPKT